MKSESLLHLSGVSIGKNPFVTYDKTGAFYFRYANVDKFHMTLTSEDGEERKYRINQFEAEAVRAFFDMSALHTVKKRKEKRT